MSTDSVNTSGDTASRDDAVASRAAGGSIPTVVDVRGPASPRGHHWRARPGPDRRRLLDARRRGPHRRAGRGVRDRPRPSANTGIPTAGSSPRSSRRGSSGTETEPVAPLRFANYSA